MNKNLNKNGVSMPISLIDVQETVFYNMSELRSLDMTAVNYTQFREKMKYYMDMATIDNEPIVITRKKDNVVMISLDEYNNMMENLYLMSNPKYYNELLEAMERVEKGKYEIHDLIEE